MQAAAEYLQRVNLACAQIFENPKKWSAPIKELQAALPLLPREMVELNKIAILGVAYLAFKNLSEDNRFVKTKKITEKKLLVFFFVFSYKEKDREVLVDVFRMVFEKITTDKTGVFFNFSGFLLSEVFDPATHKGDLNLNCAVKPAHCHIEVR